MSRNLSFHAHLPARRIRGLQMWVRALWLVALTATCGRQVHGQEETAGERHQSSLGLDFRAVPGSVALFATTETRVADFQTFVSASNHAWTFKPHFSQSGDHPVVGVNLQDALAFCNWLTERERASGKITSAQLYRLPTSREWSAAAGIARARKTGDVTAEDSMADQQRFPWGLTWPPPTGSGNFAADEIPGFSDEHPFTAPVGGTLPTTEGLFDLAGNVWEWTWDPDLRAAEVGQVRGGSWAYFREDALRSSHVYQVPVAMRASTIGFRVVFEDRQRTAQLLAQNKIQREEEMAERREQVLGPASVKLSEAELEAMRQRLAAGAGSASTLPDVSSLQPAKPGASFFNTLGLTLLPLPGLTTLVGEAEVSVGQYEVFLKDAGKTWPDKPSHLTSNQHPVAAVSWEQAMEFCEWLTQMERKAGLIAATASYRLPSDLEWSAAAGLPDEDGADPAQRHLKNDTHFPWKGAQEWPPPKGAANLDAPNLPGFDDLFAYTAPVKATDPNDLGFYELAGNVTEWCADVWPDEPSHRVLRGGSWLSSAREELLTSSRRHAPADTARGNAGFRVALELTGTSSD